MLLRMVESRALSSSEGVGAKVGRGPGGLLLVGLKDC